MTVVVFGSINMDLVTRTPRLPQPSETIIGSEFFTTPGGKGANQAVALAKLKVPTQMVGRVGSDGFGHQLLDSLQTCGVKIRGVHVDHTTHSGVAVITVADNGENQIIGVPGANGELDESDIARLLEFLPGADALLLQLEVPLKVVRRAVQVARGAGVRVLLDPAPVPTEAIADLYPLVDILLPNEVEASYLIGFPVNSPESAAEAAHQLQQQGAQIVIIKLGAQGAFCATPTERFFVPAFAVDAIDTVAAGDAFAGGLTAALVAGHSMREAVLWGTATGALATTKSGAQTAMPDRETLEAFLERRGVGD
jgi:ribokinase